MWYTTLVSRRIEGAGRLPETSTHSPKSRRQSKGSTRRSSAIAECSSAGTSELNLLLEMRVLTPAHESKVRGCVLTQKQGLREQPVDHLGHKAVQKAKARHSGILMRLA